MTRNVASFGTLRERRALVEAAREVVPVALDLFELGREDEIPLHCDGRTLADLLQLALVDYRNRYTDTRREELVRRDLSDETLLSPDGRRVSTRRITCLFCARVLALRATTRQSYRIAALITSDPILDSDTDEATGKRDGFHVRVADSVHRQFWCVGDVADAIRPHVVTCALTSLGCLRAPLRPGDNPRETGDGPLFGGGV